MPGQARRAAHRDGAVVHRLRGHRPPGHDAGRGRGAGPRSRAAPSTSTTTTPCRSSCRPRPSGWASRPPDVTYAVEDQLAQGEFFEHWPMLSTPEMDDHYRGVDGATPTRRRRGGGTRARRAGVITEREAWGIVYSLSVSTVATAAAVTLAVGLCRRARAVGPHGRSRGLPAAAVEEAIRIGNPFPQASRFVREPFQSATCRCEPGDQVLMWLTAANRDLPGPHAAAVRPVRPAARQRPAAGLRLRLPPVRRRAPRPRGRRHRGHHPRRALPAACASPGRGSGSSASTTATSPHPRDRGAVNPPIGLRCRS